MVDVLLPQHLNGLLGSPRQFLVDVNIGVVGSKFFIRDMDVAPCQPQNLAHTQRAGKREVHSHIEFAVRALLADFGQAPGGIVPVLRQG